MLYRRLSPSGDYTFGKNQQDFLSGAYSVGQAIKTRLQLWLGEWWENTDDGLPVFENILGASGTPENLQAIDLIIRDRILGTQGVLSVSNLESTYSDRTYSVTAEVESEYGPVTVEVSF